MLYLPSEKHHLVMARVINAIASKKNSRMGVWRDEGVDYSLFLEMEYRNLLLCFEKCVVGKRTPLSAMPLNEFPKVGR